MEIRYAGRSRSFTAAAILHLLLLVGLLERRVRGVAIRFPGTATGTHVSPVYLPGRSSAAALAAVKPADTPLSRQMKPVDEKKVAGNSSMALGTSASPSDGNNARGSGNVTVALAQFFPWPRPDLSSVPRGTRGDVVVDVTIDEQGRIVETQVAQSMGAAIDGQVLAVVETWVFKPATKDGVAIPSEQELLFHFEHG